MDFPHIFSNEGRDEDFISKLLYRDNQIFFIPPILGFSPDSYILSPKARR